MLKRPLTTYAALTPRAVSDGSPAQVFAFVEDAKHDIAELAAENERLRKENSHLHDLNKEAHAIVDRIWAIFGTPSYEQLAGRTIYDLVQDAVDRAAARDEAMKELGHG